MLVRIIACFLLVALPLLSSAEDWESYIDSSKQKALSFDDEKMRDYRNDGDYDYSSVSVPTPSNWQIFWRKFFDKLFKDVDPRNVRSFWSVAKWVLVVLMLGIMVYLAIRSNGSRVRNRRDFGNSKVDILGFQGAESDLVELLRQAESQNNYHQAIRYLLIHLLHQLTESNDLQWDGSRTNREYIRVFTRYYDEEKLRFINRIFETSYYGEIEINASDYQKSKGYYSDLLKSKGARG